MKSYDLKPTYDNLFHTFLNDSIDRNVDIFRFITVLDSIEDSHSIALDGRWGSGKTFFVKQTKMVMDAHNQYIRIENEENRNQILTCCQNNREIDISSIQPQVCVYYDAWENDNDDDPVLSLVYTILNSIDSDYSFKDMSCLSIAASIMEVFSGRNWKQVLDQLKGDNPLDGLKKAKSIERMVNEFLQTLLPEKGNRLVVFIDELDRCKPSFAVCLLERIKHYFLNDQITFVFSININELQHTICKHYGNDFDGSRYLDRFFDLRLTLPPPNLEKFYASLPLNVSSDYYYDMACVSVIKAYHFELREVSRYLKLAKISAYAPTHDERRRYNYRLRRELEFGMMYIIPIMIGLKISNTNRYIDFIEGRDAEPLLEIAGNQFLELFRQLLNEGETYDEGTSSLITVTVEDKLKEVYRAIFIEKYQENPRYLSIGSYRFDEATKKNLLRIDGLFSIYAQFNDK